MSNDPKQGGSQHPMSDLPPYERIMQQQNTAQSRNASQQAPQKAKTLEEAAAQRAQARQKAMQAAAARQRAAQAGNNQQESEHRAAAPNGPAQKKHQASKGGNHKQPPKRKKRRRIPWVAIVLLVCMAIVVVAAVQFGRNWVLPANADDTQLVEVEIPAGTPVSEMGDLLEEQGIIRSANSFSLYVRLKGVAGNLQAGVHDLAPSMTLEEVVETLQQGAEEAGLVKVTVNEGLTIDQIGDVIDESTRYSKQEFLDLMSNQTFLEQLVQQYPILTDSYNNANVRYVLEGYLFPATYDMTSDDTLESLVTQMVDKTNEVLSKYQADINASPYSLQDIMSIASLVEKEGVTTEDRKLIAGVFYNRLEAGMPIQSDISVLYALGTHKEVVTYDDLQVDSPYNLYLNTGLPPGPFNSPSEDAIVAALEPTDSDYLYFYANIKTGEVFYTSDYEQHLKWQEEYEETGDIQN
ncbi:MAG: endolytic transglycosylase MltG [Peptococcaceae bacterium]|nr:endolytic transglycosylase MltG [Peptococcaceae bacterium]